MNKHCLAFVGFVCCRSVWPCAVPWVVLRSLLRLRVVPPFALFLMAPFSCRFPLFLSSPLRHNTLSAQLLPLLTMSACTRRAFPLAEASAKSRSDAASRAARIPFGGPTERSRRRR